MPLRGFTGCREQTTLINSTLRINLTVNKVSSCAARLRARRCLAGASGFDRSIYRVKSNATRVTKKKEKKKKVRGLAEDAGYNRRSLVRCSRNLVPHTGA